MRGHRESPDRRWRNQVVRQQDHYSARVLWRTLMWIVVALAPGGSWLVQQSECLQFAYELSDLRAEHERLVGEERKRSIEKAGLESWAGVEEWAQRQGFVRPRTEAVVVLEAHVQSASGDLIAVVTRDPRGPGRDPSD